jgi:hypothetical protein
LITPAVSDETFFAPLAGATTGCCGTRDEAGTLSTFLWFKELTARGSFTGSECPGEKAPFPMSSQPPAPKNSKIRMPRSKALGRLARLEDRLIAFFASIFFGKPCTPSGCGGDSCSTFLRAFRMELTVRQPLYGMGRRIR